MSCKHTSGLYTTIINQYNSDKAKVDQIYQKTQLVIFTQNIIKTESIMSF